MVFWSILIATLLWIYFYIETMKISKKYNWEKDNNSKIVEYVFRHDDELLFAEGATILILGMIVFIMLIIIIYNHCGINARVQKWRETYDALTYKLESDACRDEFCLLNKEIIDEIQGWNEDVKYNQGIQRDFWVGIFYPNVFDEFETIDYYRYQSSDTETVNGKTWR